MKDLKELTRPNIRALKHIHLRAMNIAGQKPLCFWMQTRIPIILRTTVIPTRCSES